MHLNLSSMIRIRHGPDCDALPDGIRKHSDRENINDICKCAGQSGRNAGLGRG